MAMFSYDSGARPLQNYSDYKEKVEDLLLKLSRLDNPEVTRLITHAGL